MFYILVFGSFCRGLKSSAPIIERICTFDAKIYKIVDAIFSVSLCAAGNKKIFKLFYFCFQLPLDLVENRAVIQALRSSSEGRYAEKKGLARQDCFG